MRKILFAAILVAVATVGSSAQAGEADVWKKWSDGLKASKVTITDQIAQIEANHPAFCADGLKGNAASLQFCTAASKLKIATAQKDAAMIELKLAATRLNPNRRDEALNIYPAGEINNERAVWQRRQSALDRLLMNLKAD